MNAVSNVVVRQRPDFGTFVERISDFEGSHLFDKLAEELVVDLVDDEESFGRDA